MSRKIILDPLTRLEGHGRVEILLGEGGDVEAAYLVVPELRGFESFCVGRLAEEMPRLTARICGLCPHAHHLASAKALDELFGCPPSATGRKIRELFYQTYFFLDHTTHFFLLAGPDWFFEPDAEGGQDFFALAKQLGGELTRRVVRIRSRNRHLLEAMGGRSMHAVAALPGGWSCAISEETRAEAVDLARENLEFALASLEIFRDRILPRLGAGDGTLDPDGGEEVHSMGTVDAADRPSYYDGEIRVVDPEGEEIARYAPRDYLEHVAERTESWTYLKMPYLRKVGWKGLVGGRDSGIYAATPLARLNVVDAMATPRADEAFEEMQHLLGREQRQGRFPPLRNPALNHWARWIETIQAAERMLELAQDREVCGPEFRRPVGSCRGEGVGSLEAPRGTLTHHYQADEDGRITAVNLLVGTTNHHAAMAMTLTREARRLLGDGAPLRPEHLRQVESAIRAYDPCLSCATHSLPGRMNLVVEVRDASGVVVDRVERFP